MALETIDPNAPLAPNVGSTTTGGLGTYSPSVPYKVVSGGKNQLNTITPTTGMLMSPEASGAIKNNMQEMLKKYQNPYDEFQSTLDDMVARTQLRPADALRQRAEERQQKEANIYNLKMAMANNEAAQKSAQSMASAIGLGGTSGGVPLAPGVSANAPTAGGTQGTMVPTWMDMLKSLPVEQQPIGMAYINGGDIGSFNKLVAENSLKKPDTQKIWQWAQTQSPEVQDMVKGQLFEKGLAPRSYIDPKTGKTILSSPAAAMPPSMAAPTGTANAPSVATNVAPITNLGNIRPQGQSTGFQTFNTPEEGLAAIDKNLQSYGQKGVNTLEGIISRWAPPNENDTAALIANASKRLGLDPKQPLDMGNPAVRQAVGTAIMLQEHGNKIFATAAPSVGGAQAPSAQAPNGPIFQEDVKLQQENLGRANTSFIKGTYDPLAERVNAQEGQRVFVDSILKAVETGDYGPGTSIGQMTSQAAQAVGLPLSQAERENYLRNLTIENAKKQFVASGAKAAMGSQYTAKESENFEKTLAGINDPKEYIKSVYQIKRASALTDEAHKQFLEDNAGDMIKAEREWKKSGIRDKIFTETVDAFKKKLASTESKPASTAKPAGAPADAKIGTDADGKPGWFVVRDGKTLQWKP